MKFRYLNLHTIYSYEITNENGKVISEYKNEIDDGKGYATPCFNRYFVDINNEGLKDTSFNIYINTLVENVDEYDINNYCYLSYDELIKWLDELKKIVDYKYTVSEIKDGYIVSLKTVNSTSIINKWLVTSIRYVYELPSALALKEAFVLQSNGYFTDMNLIDLFHMTLYCTCYNTGDQEVVKIVPERMPRFKTYKSLKDDLYYYRKDGKLNMLYDYIAMPDEVSRYHHINQAIAQILISDDSTPDEFFRKNQLDTRYKLIYKPLYTNLLKLNR